MIATDENKITKVKTDSSQLRRQMVPSAQFTYVGSVVCTT